MRSVLNEAGQGALTYRRTQNYAGMVYEVISPGGARLGLIGKRRHRGVGGFGRYRHQAWAHDCWMIYEPAGHHRSCFDTRLAAASSLIGD